MPTTPENRLRYRTLFDSPIVSVSDYQCASYQGGPAGEEYSGDNNIVLMRHGAFCKHFGRRRITADVNEAVFFSSGSTYRVSHPTGCGDRGTVFTTPNRILQDIVRELDPGIDDHAERPFPFVTGPCDGGVFWQHRKLVQRLEAAESDPLEPLWADVTALQLIADVLEAAFTRHGLPRKRSREGTDSDHADRVEAAKVYLASRQSERITLDDVAAAVFVSPFHLSRLFQQRTGVPIHRYLTRLRLRTSLERLSDGARNITSLALELGFSSHSHFTDSFRREFGQPPSALRAARRTLREMSKNLEV